MFHSCDPMDCSTQAPLSVGFPMQDWRGLPFPSPGHLLSEIEPMSPALAGGFFTTEPSGKLWHTDTHTHTIFSLPGKQPKFLSTIEWINKLWNILFFFPLGKRCLFYILSSSDCGVKLWWIWQNDEHEYFEGPCHFHLCLLHCPFLSVKSSACYRTACQ